MKNEIIRLREEGHTYTQICQILGCSKGTVAYHCGFGQKEKTRQRNQESKEKNNACNKVWNFKTAELRRQNRSKKDAKTRVQVKLGSFKKGKRRGYTEIERESFTLKDVVAKFGQQTRCYLTGRSIDLYDPNTYNLDHIVPIAKGGNSLLENLGVLNPQANAAKSDMTVKELLALCKEILEHNGYVVKYGKVTQPGRVPD